MAVMRAKMKVEVVNKTECGERVEFRAVPGTADENTFCASDPWASCAVLVTCGTLYGRFRPGDLYLVDFRHAA